MNLSTDAVQPSRVADSIALELIPEIPPTTSADGYQPWAAHGDVGELALDSLTPTEQTYLANVTSDNAQAGAQLALHARLLHVLDDDVAATELVADQLEEGARTLLARISISMASLNPILTALEDQQVVNPNDITVNNLVRPFLVTPSQLAFIHRQP